MPRDFVRTVISFYRGSCKTPPLEPFNRVEHVERVEILHDLHVLHGLKKSLATDPLTETCSLYRLDAVTDGYDDIEVV